MPDLAVAALVQERPTSVITSVVVERLLRYKTHLKRGTLPAA
jgi:hypothetical protein